MKAFWILDFGYGIWDLAGQSTSTCTSHESDLVDLRALRTALARLGLGAGLAAGFAEVVFVGGVGFAAVAVVCGAGFVVAVVGGGLGAVVVFVGCGLLDAVTAGWVGLGVAAATFGRVNALGVHAHAHAAAGGLDHHNGLPAFGRVLDVLDAADVGKAVDLAAYRHDRHLMRLEQVVERVR